MFCRIRGTVNAKKEGNHQNQTLCYSFPVGTGNGRDLSYHKDIINPLSYVFYYFQKLWYITIVLRDKIKYFMKEGIDHEKDV